VRFLPAGPDVPAELIAAQEKGQTIFVCGAGVSRSAGLPLFRGLVEGVYQQLGEDWTLHPAEREGMRPGGKIEGQYDRVLRCLERRLAASDAPGHRGMRERIRAAVRHVLKPPDGADLPNHLALLELSRDAEGRSRLLTTNFETLFERAWFDKYQTAIATHAGMAMPQPKVAGCTGVLHLHGRLSDPRPELNAFETELVLTSAEFGDAYLRSGWASRYIYDLVRAYTVVLVGYQADDPPMRYLLEALEADRERYPDLQKVYAFASSLPGEEELQSALWAAKAVEPILYTANGDDHSLLYDSLQEWCRYAQDPTAWRREQLRTLLDKPPASRDEAQLAGCIALLSHGDAGQILGELNPTPEWLPILVERRVFTGRSLPGEWIEKRISDPDMIRAVAVLGAIDDQARWYINRGLERQKATMTPVRRRAWRLILSAQQSRRSKSPNDSWYLSVGNIRRGEADFEACRLVTQILRPQLTIAKAMRWGQERQQDGQEVLHDLLRIEFDPAEDPQASEILGAWPYELEPELALFRSLDRALMDSLEEARGLGLIQGWDRTVYDVPSVAAHPQNAHHHGFYPITRAIADLWQRIVGRDPNRARQFIKNSEGSPFLLTKRIALFAYEHAVFSPREAVGAVHALDDQTFWENSLRVELMRLLAARWSQFEPPDRELIERRLRAGPPRELYPTDAFERDEEWRSVVDSQVFRCLHRLAGAGHSLAPESNQLLDEISTRHPQWEPSPGDRDDFHFWSESGWAGPAGEPDLLAKIADDRLVREAMRIQREQHFDQGDVWRLFCSADPNRALRGLILDSATGEWDVEAWRSLLWTAAEKEDAAFQAELAGAILAMPAAPLTELLPAATSWLQRRREMLANANQPGGEWFYRLWDRFADLTYDDAETEQSGGDDLATEALNRPGGILAWALLDALSTPKPHRNSGLGAVLKPRFDRLAAAGGRPGLLARAYLARSLAYLDAIDPAWTEEHFTPRLLGPNPEALALWRSFAHGGIGSARLFNALKPAMLQHFENRQLSDEEFEGIISNLLSIIIWHQRGEGSEYQLTAAELRRALTVGPSSARRNVAWNLWRIMGNADGEPADKAARWLEVIGPVFRDIWPLDARLRSKGTTTNLVLMALECDAAFPEAVEAILDVLVPYELYQIDHSLRLESQHRELTQRYPRAVVKLANALVDPNMFSVPTDLAAFLQECLTADPSIANDLAYIRLYGLRRQRNA
jgi:hypothetical protein